MHEDVKMKPFIFLYVNLRNWEGKFGKIETNIFA